MYLVDDTGGRRLMSEEEKKEFLKEMKKYDRTENNIKNLYMLMSFKGDFDIYRLKERHPEMYEEIIGEKNAENKRQKIR